jgi:hypothetical protein
MERAGSENFLRAMQSWGLPIPPVSSQPVLPEEEDPLLAGLMPPIPAAAPVDTGMAPIMPMPLLGTAPAVTDALPAPETASGFEAASFAPPAPIAEDPSGIFGAYMDRIGMRSPSQAAQGAAPASALRAQPAMMPQQPRKPPLPRVHSSLARRFPSSARAAEMVDRARREKGWI